MTLFLFRCLESFGETSDLSLQFFKTLMGGWTIYLTAVPSCQPAHLQVGIGPYRGVVWTSDLRFILHLHSEKRRFSALKISPSSL